MNWFIICNVFTKDSYDHMNWNMLAICIRQEESIKWYIPIHCWLEKMILKMAYKGIGNYHNLFPLQCLRNLKKAQFPLSSMCLYLFFYILKGWESAIYWFQHVQESCFLHRLLNKRSFVCSTIWPQKGIQSSIHKAKKIVKRKEKKPRILLLINY